MAYQTRILKNGLCEINQWYSSSHEAIDIVGANYTLDYILAHSKGTVVMIQTGQVNNIGSTGNLSYGNFVKIKHDNGYYTLYAHLATVNVKVNQVVNQKEIIGYMGNTGNSTGAHLHFEVRNENDVRIDPYPYLNKDLPSQYKVVDPVVKDENNNQIKVNTNDLNVRINPGLDSLIIGIAKENGIYNYSDVVNKDNYNWYKIGDNNYIAYSDTWATLYPKNDISEVEQLKNKIASLEKEIEELKNGNYSTFTAVESDNYYLYLNQNEILKYIITK